MRYLALITLLAIAAPAAAEESAAPAKTKKEKKVCRRDVNTETIIPKSICRTRSEWTQIDAAKQKQAQRDTEAMGNRGSGGGMSRE
ncbi:hypothetical protein E2493_12745 [Sphingomonas parva]|uniref:Uncharacterized protein n=1 Tax=Sphingomonas parva TaxID=2555898 RepID=A0A4Y8ZRU9_9SPHN|nr:hypothetical protein [Sphingomonas parva]TFI57855.1 hypothetical protein E2493_12745 [Sphingomonas parva]